MKKYVLISSLLLCLLGVFTYLISPVKELEKTKYKGTTLQSLLKGAQGKDLVVQLSQSEFQINYQFSEKLLNEFIKYQIQLADQGIEAIELELKPNLITLHVHKKLGFLKTQYIIELKPKLSNGVLSLQVIDSKMGRLPLPSSLILSRINLGDIPSVEIVGDQIVLFKTLPKGIQFQDVEISDKNLKVVMNIKITSITDLMEIGAFMIPYGINLLEKFG